MSTGVGWGVAQGGEKVEDFSKSKNCVNALSSDALSFDTPNLACTKKTGLNQNDQVLNGSSLGCTKKIGLSQNDPMLNWSSLGYTKKI